MSDHDSVVSGRSHYFKRLIVEGSAFALPALARFSVAERGGLITVAAPEPALDPDELETLARFRFAQYLAAGCVDEDVAWRERIEHVEPAAYRSRETVHYVVADAANGMLVASLCVIGPPPAPPQTTIAERERPLFGVEGLFGWTPFNRMPEVAEAPLARVREYARLVKNLRHPAASRAVVEVLLAAMRTDSEFDIGIGQLEPNRLFDLFPLAVLHGGLPVFAAGHVLNPGLEGRERHPFAFAVADVARAQQRLDAIEAALELPETQAIRALGALRRKRWAARSSLVPAGGIPALCDLALPQRALPTAVRRWVREDALRLARLRPFAELSESELTALNTLAVKVDVDAGTILLAREEAARELIVIDEGPGRILGAAGVLDGTPEPLAVVARTPLRTLRLSSAIYDTYLRELPDVAGELRALAPANAPSPSPSPAWTGSRRRRRPRR